MRHIEEMRDRLKSNRNPGHAIGTFLLEHSNSADYLVSQLEGWLEAAKADQAEERAFAGHLFRPKSAPDRFRDAIAKGTYDGFVGFNQFRHDVSVAMGGDGDLLDDLLNKHEGLGERDRLTTALEEFLKVV